MSRSVLVAYATRHGATAGIASRVAAALTAAGLPAEARPVEDVKDVEPYEAVVIGGAAYMFHWLRPAVTFARRHRKELAARPVWVFSSGPLGTELVDKDGKNVLEATRPKEFDELTKLLHPRGEQVFFGARPLLLLSGSAQVRQWAQAHGPDRWRPSALTSCSSRSSCSSYV
ncbi:flavodoxin [Trebonia kvetii]|uniref:Flavodoxin n=1 Tax=Trebonia kvetii TaxID=2480626 RepID=A0A6P2C7G4_9ACTN|nr:flavodoxin [Trebonia kvetii]